VDADVDCSADERREGGRVLSSDLKTLEGSCFLLIRESPLLHLLLSWIVQDWSAGYGGGDVVTKTFSYLIVGRDLVM